MQMTHFTVCNLVRMQCMEQWQDTQAFQWDFAIIRCASFQFHNSWRRRPGKWILRVGHGNVFWLLRDSLTPGRSVGAVYLSIEILEVCIHYFVDWIQYCLIKIVKWLVSWFIILSVQEIHSYPIFWKSTIHAGTYILRCWHSLFSSWILVGDFFTFLTDLPPVLSCPCYPCCPWSLLSSLLILTHHHVSL